VIFTLFGSSTNNRLIKFESGSHWYGKDGTPQHDADLRVARKEFLYPSVTTIDKDVFKNDFLDRWRMNELAAAAASTFKQAHETDEDYANRIYELSLEKSKTASEFGKEIHAAIEDYPTYPLDLHLHPWLDRFGGWYNSKVEQVLERERILLDHDLGIAGRCDFIAIGNGDLSGRVILVDFKTQKVKKDPKTGKKKPAWYDSWVRQLAFYAVAYAKGVDFALDARSLADRLPTCISVVLDSNEPETPFEKVWTKEEILDAYRTFVAGAWLWFEKRSYYPVGKWAPSFPFQMPV
jgi:hypothetical protein